MYTTLALGTCVFLIGCSAVLPSGESEPAPRSAAEQAVTAPPESRPATLLVKEEDPLGRWQLGQVVTVDGAHDLALSPQFPVVTSDSSPPADSIPAALLGPANGGVMIVTASQLNVRRCPRTDCPVVTYLVRADSVVVMSFEAGWYRLAGGGYAHARYLALPLVFEHLVFVTTALQFGLFYDTRLAPLAAQTPTFSGPLFSSQTLRLQDRAVLVELSTPFFGGPPMRLVCDALEITANFVEQMVREMVSDGYTGYSVRVLYQGSPDIVVANTNPDRSLTCKLPY